MTGGTLGAPRWQSSLQLNPWAPVPDCQQSETKKGRMLSTHAGEQVLQPCNLHFTDLSQVISVRVQTHVLDT